jgi:zinc transport system substrate-binding protein
MIAKGLQIAARQSFFLVLVSLGCGFITLFFSGCRPSVADDPDRPFKVVTSFLPVYAFTTSIAGDLIEVENLLPAGVGPHDYQFSPRDIRKLREADLLVVNGLGLEDWLARAIRSVGGRGSKLKVVEAAAGLDQQLIHGVTRLQIEDEPAPRSRRHRHHHQHDQGEANPHIWLDPRLAMHAVGNILEALKETDPANAAGYEENARKYLARLEALDAELLEGLSPIKEQPIITYHDAFPYFARRYELNLVGVIEKVPEVAPSARYLESLMQAVRHHEVKAIFTEPQFSPRLASQIARDLEIEVGQLDTLEAGPLTPESYEEGMRRNLHVLQKHLSP